MFFVTVHLFVFLPFKSILHKNEDSYRFNAPHCHSLLPTCKFILTVILTVKTWLPFLSSNVYMHIFFLGQALS